LAKLNAIETFIEVRIPAIFLVPDRLFMRTTLQVYVKPKAYIHALKMPRNSKSKTNGSLTKTSLWKHLVLSNQ